jgi:hypothetical protein
LGRSRERKRRKIIVKRRIGRKVYEEVKNKGKNIKGGKDKKKGKGIFSPYL